MPTTAALRQTGAVEDLGGIALVVLVGVLVLVSGVIAGRTGIPLPIVALVLGGAVGFIPALSEVALPPELVLLIFLPPLLYWESLNTSLREIRANLRVILLLSIGLVFATAAVVAVVAHAFGMPWSIALALGAILAPTDAAAVLAAAGRLPRRGLTTLRAESLINDGTALVIYAIAVEAAISGAAIEPLPAAGRFLASYVGAALIGAVAVALITLVRRVIRERLLLNTLSVVTPFLVYLPAEALEVSGVVAVVVTGLGLSLFAGPTVPADARTEAIGFWRLTTYLLNAALFVLVGVELHNVTAGVGGSWATALGLGLVIAAAVVLTRLTWFNTTPYLVRALDRRPSQRARRVSWRVRFPLAWAGFRGGISLAAALALPLETADGDPLPFRDEVIAITFVVILVTLVVLGSFMRRIVAWARMPTDPEEPDEELLAEQAGAQAALDVLPDAAVELGVSDEVRDRAAAGLRHRLARIHRDEGDPSESRRDEAPEVDAEEQLRLRLLAEKRRTLFGLRNSGRIDDAVVRRMQARYDLEELRLRGVADED